MLEMQKSITLQGTVSVQAEGEKTPVVNMFANITENGSQNITKTITDRALYLANKDTVDADMAAFEQTALALVQ